MTALKTNNYDLIVRGVRISRNMASKLLAIYRGYSPYWPSRTIRALHSRGLVYPEADRGGRFMLSDLGIEVVKELSQRRG